MRTPASSALLLATVSLTACVIGANKYPRPRDLEPTWQVSRARVLAIQASPPEIAPGESATFQALLPDPDERLSGALWVACTPEETTPFGCAIDLSLLDGEPTPAELAAAGVIGFEPAFPPAWTAPDTALDEVPDVDRLEGRQFTAQVIGLPEAPPDTGVGLDFSTFLIAYKRIIVSEAATPNHNPTIDVFTVDGAVLLADDVAEVTAGQAVELGVTVPDDAVETYTYVNPDGESEERVEQPWVAWFATAGDNMEGTTIYPFTQSDWTAPSDGTTDGVWWAVVRDRRGGVAWVARQWHVL